MSQTVDLNFQRSGSGMPVVILHGLFGSARNWQTIARRLATDYSVITVDLRNHGSSPHVARMDYVALGADLSKLLETLDLRDVSLIGHSMGGKTAMTLVLREPDRIARLIVVDIGPGAYANEYDEMLDAMTNLDLDTITSRGDADSRLAPAIPDKDIRLFILHSLRFNGDVPPTWRFNLATIRNGIGDLIGAIPCAETARFDRPAYFIGGENSTRIRDGDLAAIGRHFPTARMVTISNAGHWPHAENPQEFLTKLRRVLAEKQTTSV
jgi:esterase